MDETIAEVRDLRKAYGGQPAVDGVSFHVCKGEVFGLLGPNGAGKTTTLECLEGLRRPDSGDMRVMGVDVVREGGGLKDLIGVQLQTSGLPANMTVDEAMNFFCAYHGMTPRPDLIDRMGLGEKRAAQCFQLSTGQQRRLSLALAVAHRPPVVLLDEPTAGLDVATRSELHLLMQELRAEGASVILATHDMAEAEKMADRVGILLRGRIMATGSPRELTASGEGLTRIAVRTEQSVLAGGAGTFPAVQRRKVEEEYAILFTTDPGLTVSAILDYVREQGDRLVDLRVERPSLEERFMEITTEGGTAAR